ncbi:hypothetical protein B0H14DRAFT_225659 [Mycena olivaceomarginata]|nr:hypothetical protein B0H14DRAFT_225659 [Mycena olivaceomarginata]
MRAGPLRSQIRPSQPRAVDFCLHSLALGNIGNATSFLFTRKSLIDDRDYPGGPGAYFVEQSTNWSAVVCNSVYIVNTWFQDGIL